MSAWLKVICPGQRRPRGAREPHDTYLTVFSAYAPTAKATPRVKEQFYSELQDALTKVPHNDILIILGDFNARVGKSENLCGLECVESLVWGVVMRPVNLC